MTNNLTLFKENVQRRLNNWVTIVNSVRQRVNVNDDMNDTLINSTVNSRNRNVSFDTSRLQVDYTELMNGSIPCPSCNGSGLIPKELESTLVALIPVNDKRLKPNKTWLYVLIWFIVCIFIASGAIFLIMPKAIMLTSDNLPIQFVTVYNLVDNNETDFYFMNKLNVTSGNYLPISIVNVTSIIISKVQPYSSDLVGYGSNSTITEDLPLTISGGSTELFFNNTVKLKGFASNYCQADFWHLTPVYISLRFDVAVTLLYYYGHKEQTTLSIEQEVCCIPTGNCTT